jgi:antirestriction protein
MIQEGTLLDAATDYFDDCFINDIPEAVRGYIDYEAFARDIQLGGDMTEFDYQGQTYTCTNSNSL